jgi:hypothetical protein
MQPVSMTSPGAPHYQQRADTRSYPSLHSRAVCQSARSYPSLRDTTNYCKRFLSFSSSVSLEVPEHATTTTQDPTRDHTPVSATYRPSPQHTDHLRNIPTISATYRPSPQHTDHLRVYGACTSRGIRTTIEPSPHHRHRESVSSCGAHSLQYHNNALSLQYHYALTASLRTTIEPSPHHRHRELRALAQEESRPKETQWAILRTPPALVPRSALVAPTRYSIIMRYHYSIIMHLQYCNEWAPALVPRSPLVAPTRYSIIMRGTRFMACAASPTCVSLGRLSSCAASTAATAAASTAAAASGVISLICSTRRQ